MFAHDRLAFPSELATDEETARSAWIIASTLATIDFYWRGRQRVAIAQRPWVDPQITDPRALRSVEVLAHYASGWVGFVEPLASSAPWESLLESLQLDLQAMDEARAEFGDTRDVFSSNHEWLKLPAFC